MNARGKEEPHKKAMHKDGKPIVSLDYKTFGEEADEDDNITMLVIKDEPTGDVAAHVCTQKGTAYQWVVERLVDDINIMGHTGIILKRGR